MIIEVNSEQETKALAARIGNSLKGGEVFELVGDVGAGKTTFVKGLALGLGIYDDVQSPSFTISRVYDARENLQLVHYDFYRLSEPGIMANEVAEMIRDAQTITIIEWSGIVENILPTNRYTITFESPSESVRRLTIPTALEASV